MADSFLRRLRILQMLQLKDDGVITIPEIKSRLYKIGFDDIQNKTIERDMVDLSTKLNISCDSTQRPFQWWWNGKEDINVPSMSRNSALTFKLALHYLEPLLPLDCLNHLKSKLIQSKKIFSGKNIEKDLHWFNKIRIIPKGLAQVPAKVSDDVQKAVYDALYEEKMLEITYRSRIKNETTVRKIHPLALIYRGITTELIFCAENSTVVKRFILNRIKQARVQIQSLQTPEDFNLDQYLEKNLGFPGTCEEIQFKAWVSDYSRAEVEETPLCKHQKIVESKDGGIIITATIRETADLTAWILGKGSQIEVLEPEFLRTAISDQIKSMSEIYHK